MRQGVILSLCDYTGIMVEPWAEAGFDCLLVDIRHPAGVNRNGRITTVCHDVNTFVHWFRPAGFVAAFPPCTHLAVSGARWFARKGLAPLVKALELVESCRRLCEISEAPWMIENPVGRLSTLWRKPDYYFDPCDYAGYLDDPTSEAYTKKTCLWTGGGFIMPEPRRVEPVGKNPIHHMPPSKDRGLKRSVTPRGFARAVFEANVGGK